jgi:hypothetical protein
MATQIQTIVCPACRGPAEKVGVIAVLASSGRQVHLASLLGWIVATLVTTVVGITTLLKSDPSTGDYLVAGTLLLVGVYGAYQVIVRFPWRTESLEIYVCEHCRREFHRYTRGADVVCPRCQDAWVEHHVIHLDEHGVGRGRGEAIGAAFVGGIGFVLTVVGVANDVWLMAGVGAFLTLTGAVAVARYPMSPRTTVYHCMACHYQWREHAPESVTTA